MRRMIAFSLPLLILLAGIACSGESDSPTEPGRGSLTVNVNPNPLVAIRVAGMDGKYDFPFEVVLTETGGETVTLTGIHIDVKAIGIRVVSKTYDATYLRSQNYSPIVPARTTVRYSFNPREDAPDAIFSSSVEADVRVEGMDGKGNQVRQTKTISVIRR